MDYQKEFEKILLTTEKKYDEVLLKEDIVLYGAGSLGHMALDLFKRAEISNFEIVDKKVNILDGRTVRKISELSEEIKKNSLFLVTICTLPYNNIVEELQENGVCYIMQFYTYAYIKFPELLKNGWFVHDISSDMRTGIMRVCEQLKHHETSLNHYLQFCWWKLREIEVVSEEHRVLSGKKYFKAPIMPALGKEEVFLDCGCYDGSIILQFIDVVNGQYKEIYAFEPDKANIKKAMEKLQNRKVLFDARAVGKESSKKKFEGNLGFASKLMETGKEMVEVVCLDDLDISPTIIKLHIEGAELDALVGARKIIEQNRPIIMVLGDHNSDGLVKIPQYAESLTNYKLYFLLHDYCGNSAIYYMIPKERIRE